MKAPSILFCICGAPDPTFGAGKVYFELLHGLRKRGWRAEVDTWQEMTGQAFGRVPLHETASILKAHIKKRQDEFDVIEYDITHLPFSRSEFSPGCLLAARSVLLELHALKPFPRRLTLKGKIKTLLRSPFFRAMVSRRRRAVVTTAREADVVHVTCPEDITALINAAVPRQKILQLPYGLSSAEFQMLAGIGSQKSSVTRVLFLGSFDWRKGAAEIPTIFQAIAKELPDVQFRMAGTAGLFPDEMSVRAHFPQALQEKLEIIPKFSREHLPEILAGCTVGIFPSRLEGFGLAVLEQMAAGIPVAAYRAPGASMLLPDDALCLPGDTAFLANKLTHWLANPDERALAAKRQRLLARSFTWDKVIDKLDDFYRARLTR